MQILRANREAMRRFDLSPLEYVSHMTKTMANHYDVKVRISIREAGLSCWYKGAPGPKFKFYDGTRGEISYSIAMLTETVMKGHTDLKKVAAAIKYVNGSAKGYPGLALLVSHEMAHALVDQLNWPYGPHKKRRPAPPHGQRFIQALHQIQQDFPHEVATPPKNTRRENGPVKFDWIESARLPPRPGEILPKPMRADDYALQSVKDKAFSGIHWGYVYEQMAGMSPKFSTYNRSELDAAIVEYGMGPMSYWQEHKQQATLELAVVLVAWFMEITQGARPGDCQQDELMMLLEPMDRRTLGKLINVYAHSEVESPPEGGVEVVVRFIDNNEELENCLWLEADDTESSD